MWFVVLSILLITTSVVHGSEESQLAIKELHYEISKIAKEVQELYVEPDTAQIALDEKTKKALEEYIAMDISSGLPEQVELLDLKDKADDVKTSEETRKAVMDGLEYLENVKEMKSDEKQLSDSITRLEEARKASIRFDRKDLHWSIRDFEKSYHDLLWVGDSVEGDKNEEKKLKEALKRLEMYFHGMLDSYLEVATVFERIDIVDHILLGFPEVMKIEIAEGKEKIGEIRKLKEEFDLSQKILSVKGEIKVMEELRDSKVIQKLLDFMEKIKGSFESIKGSGLDLFEWKISYFAQKWIPIQNYFKNLKVFTGDLTEPLTKIGECLETFDFSMNFSTEETGSLKLDEAFKEVRDKMNQMNLLRAVEESKILAAVMKDMAKWLETEEKDWDRFAKIMAGFHSGGKIDLITKAPELEEALTEIHEAFMELDTAPIKTVSEEITSKNSKIKEFLNCSSSLKIVPSEVKSLMDQPKEVWNFDARPLQSVLEVVYLFKEAHRFLMDKKQPVPIDGFPLKKEEVTGISDRLGILKAILDYQKLWNEIPLTEELIHLDIHSNLPAVQFPKDIDSLINFYSTQYQGPQRRRILKILEGVKDYSQFPSKLEKMNEAVGKWKDWRKEQNPEEQTVDGEELIDCAESACELTLPEANPEDSLGKVEL